MPGLNLRDVRRLPVPLAPIVEQNAMEETVNRLFERNRKTKEVHTTALSDVGAIDQSILAKAFRGELVPQDPNDEPASVLLERIRAQRAADKPRRKR